MDGQRDCMNPDCRSQHSHEACYLSNEIAAWRSAALNRRGAELIALADELSIAWDTAHEAHSLRDWPADGCSQGCLNCAEKWLRARAARLAAE